MRRRAGGFTLAEVLITIGVLAVIAAISFATLSNTNYKSQVDNTAAQMVALARQAQGSAISGLNGGQWGIRFSNGAGGAQPYYAIFNGAAYSSTNNQGQHPLPAGVAYLSSTVGAGSNVDITFSSPSGASSASTSITIYSTVQPAYSSTISINSLGLVSLNQGGSGGGSGSSSQTIWVSDYNNNRVQEFSAAGAYLGQLGCGGSGGCVSSTANGYFEGPLGIAFSSSGTIWVSDFNANRVQQFNSNGTYISQIGCGGSGGCANSTANGSFHGPVGVAIDSGNNIWVADEYNNRVQEFSPTGTYIGQLGCATGWCSATTTNGKFSSPYGVNIDASGNFWIGDWSNNRFEQLSPTGTYLMQLGCGGSGGCADSSTNGYFSSCTENIAFDAGGNLWAADGYYNNRIQKFTSAGAYAGQLGCSTGGCTTASSTNGLFNYAASIAIDAGGNLWAVDQNNNRVQEFRSDNTYLGQLGCGGSGGCSASSTSGYFALPSYIAIH